MNEVNLNDCKKYTETVDITLREDYPNSAWENYDNYVAGLTSPEYYTLFLLK